MSEPSRTTHPLTSTHRPPTSVYNTTMLHHYVCLVSGASFGRQSAMNGDSCTVIPIKNSLPLRKILIGLPSAPPGLYVTQSKYENDWGRKCSPLTKALQQELLTL